MPSIIPRGAMSVSTSALHKKIVETVEAVEQKNDVPAIDLSAAAISLFSMLMVSEPALADTASMAPDNPFGGVQANSLYVTLLLFLMCVPGIWSQVKRAPKANKKRKTFEVEGPGVEGAVTLDSRARAIFAYMKKYNYEVKEMGEVITFVGLYAADRGQAAAVTFYTFIGLGCIALVLATVFPEIGNWWYTMTLIAPAAWFYYFQKGTRQEEFKVKMVTAEDDKTTDIIIEGDIEEITRLSKELDLIEKGMVRVKGIFETAA